nr:bifunctional 3-dehydroquinate dehydratase/shikimate dehydrogenase, chloroplastic-like [Ipomoea batatas]
MVVYTTLECETQEEMLGCMKLAKEEGADLVELCIHSLSFSHISQVEHLLRTRTLPSIVCYRPNAPAVSGNGGDWKSTCLQVLKLVLRLDVEFVEVALEVASDAVMAELMSLRLNSKIIVSSHVNGGEPPTAEKLGNLIINLQATRADIVKLVIDVSYITDVAPVFQTLTHCQVYMVTKIASF